MNIKMTNKELAISETLRLIKVNHEIRYSDTDAKFELSKLFDLGFEVGDIMGVLSTDYYDNPNLKNCTKKANLGANLIDIFKPKRITNKRDKEYLEYLGPEIEGYQILASDFTFQKALNYMSQKDGDLYHFERVYYDKEYHETSLEKIEKDIKKYGDEYIEEKEWLIKNYNNREVEILLMKFYQVSISEGIKQAKEIPSKVKLIWSLINWKKKDKVEFVKDKMEDYLNKLKKEYTDWKSYSYYLKK